MMKFSKQMIIATALAACLTQSPFATAVVMGQTDTFEDSTTQGWTTGLSLPATPVNVLDGGPLGASDNFLKLTSVGGRGPASRLTVINRDQWTGDFTSAGINAIDMDLRNLGATDLSVRLYLQTVSGDALTSPILLPAGGGWTHVEFAVDAPSLTELIGDVDSSNVTALRIFHNPVAGFPGPAVVAVLGVDNIHAGPEPSAPALAAVPEPSALTLLGLGLAGLYMWGKRRGFRK